MPRVDGSTFVGYHKFSDYDQHSGFFEKLFCPAYIYEFSTENASSPFILQRDSVEILPSPIDAFLYYLVLDPNNPIAGQWSLYLLAAFELIKGIIAVIQIIVEVQNQRELHGSVQDEKYDAKQKKRLHSIYAGIGQGLVRALPKFFLAVTFALLAIGFVPYAAFLVIPGVMLFDALRSLTRARKNYHRSLLTGSSRLMAAVYGLSGFLTKGLMLAALCTAFFLPLLSLPVMIVGGCALVSYTVSLLHTIKKGKVQKLKEKNGKIVDEQGEAAATIDPASGEIILNALTFVKNKVHGQHPEAYDNRNPVHGKIGVRALPKTPAKQHNRKPTAPVMTTPERAQCLDELAEHDPGPPLSSPQ